jgi:hypothetical protein
MSALLCGFDSIKIDGSAASRIDFISPNPVTSPANFFAPSNSLKAKLHTSLPSITSHRPQAKLKPLEDRVFRSESPGHFPLFFEIRTLHVLLAKIWLRFAKTPFLRPALMPRLTPLNHRQLSPSAKNQKILIQFRSVKNAFSSPLVSFQLFKSEDEIPGECK